MEYNLKIIKYANNRQQIRLYGMPIHVNEKLVNQIDNSVIQNKNYEFEKEVEENLHSILNSRNRTIQSIYEIARANNWDWFVTFTFNPEKVNSRNYDSVIYEIGLFFKSLKKKNRDLKYLLVPELHSDGQKWHVHGLLSGLPKCYFKKLDRKYNDQECYHLKNYTLGWDYHTKVQDNDKVVRYITKYITKDLIIKSKNRHRYIASSNVDRPEIMNIKIDNFDKFIDLIRDNMTWCKTIDYLDSRVTYIETVNCKDKFYLYHKIGD